MSDASLLKRAICIARDIRADLLDQHDVPRDLAGQCGLASLRLANALDDLGMLRVGFYMRVERFCGKRGRYPNLHAWCQVDGTIIDLTATQFGRCPAVHVAPIVGQDRYIETADDLDALNEIMTCWRGRELPEYARLARNLRQRRKCLRGSA